MRVSDPSTANLPVASFPKASVCIASCLNHGPEWRGDNHDPGASNGSDPVEATGREPGS